MKNLLLSLLLFSSILHADTILLVTEEIPPYAYKENNKPVGASIEIIHALFKEAAIPYNISIYPWKRAYETAKNKKSCIFPIQRTQSREAQFNWVSPVLITQTAFYKSPGSSINIRVLNDVKGHKVGTYRGSAVEEYLTAQGFDVASTTKDNVNIRKLASKRIDLWASDTLAAKYLAKKENRKIEEELVYFTTLRALACNTGISSATIDKLNQALQVIYQKGIVDEIMKKYKA